MHGRVEWVTQEVLDECEWKLAGPVPSSQPEMAGDWLPSTGSTSEGTWVTAKVRNKSWHSFTLFEWWNKIPDIPFNSSKDDFDSCCVLQKLA